VISENIITGNEQDGVHIGSSSNDNTVSNNTMYDNTYGVFVVGASNNVISENNITDNNADGVYLLSSSINNTISNNTITNNAWRGLQIYSSHNNTISGNTFQGNTKGIVIGSSNYTSVSWNTIENHSKYAIILNNANNSIIKFNIISGNNYGIFVESPSTGNVIYLNNFLDNINSVYCEDSTNYWNSSEEMDYTYNGSEFTNYLGNYWDNYFGSDADGDGLGDTSVEINSNNEDYHPLMGSFYIFIDSTPPAISNLTYPTEVVEGEGAVINVTVTDNLSGVSEVLISYSVDGGLTWTNVTMSLKTGNIYEGVIPSQAADTQVMFKIIALDYGGNIAEGPVYMFSFVSQPASGEFPTLIIVGIGAGAAVAVAVAILAKKKILFH